MDLTYKNKAYRYAMDFESIYNYSSQYKVENNPTIWKFMSIDKFDFLLKNKALFFAKPSAFIDPLEGSYSNWDIKRFDDDKITKVTPRVEMKKIQEFSAISCWHMNDYESAGMWDLYIHSDDGIAIKTNYKSLINSINDLRYKIFSGRLQYINFLEEMTSVNIFDTLFYKRKSFSHENELRLMVVASRIDEGLLESLFEKEEVPIEEWQVRMDILEEQSYEFFNEKGTIVSCKIDELIQAVYVSPKSTPTVVEKIKLMALENGLSPEKVIQSDLYKDFIY
ncbi:DUF2971 domain-containing protein [Psychrobacillus sp. NEAU-3TGS]|uniref:DUF2971 domain-containing protein n=1 Tax=Psychrobacillus sp. NEAU-3TGS TaxID=2995412 RepID=UPI002497D633|nr:DUF2971 domain-containing protein [Psychrobacillus sp. NEAU-3TGS]MDI2585831.1 DUF2971 domain-containing protein [Psychrobacillus sp. NEAU-3TGS]